VEINDVEMEAFLQGAKCPPAIGHDRLEKEWKKLLVEIISMLFNAVDIFHIRFMIWQLAG